MSTDKLVSTQCQVYTMLASRGGVFIEFCQSMAHQTVRYIGCCSVLQGRNIRLHNVDVWFFCKIYDMQLFNADTWFDLNLVKCSGCVFDCAFTYLYGWSGSSILETTTCTYNCEVHVYRKHLLYPLLSDAINITHKHASLLRAIACLWQCRPRKCINFETFNKYTMWYMYCTLVYATVSLFVLSSSPVSGAVRLDGCAGMGEIFSSSVTINPS